MAGENAGWGYTLILGELGKLRITGIIGRRPRDERMSIFTLRDSFS